MRIRKFAATAAMVIAALGMTYGTANAVPVHTDNPVGDSAVADLLPGIHYTARIVDKSVVVTTDAGSLSTEGDHLQVVDDSGIVVASVPLTYQRGGTQWPIAATIDGNTATLTPSTDPAVGIPVDRAHLPLQNVDATSNPNLNQALANFSAVTTIGGYIGTLIGTIIGAGAGCLLGAMVGTPFLAIGGPIGGCLTGIAMGVPVGIAFGTIMGSGTAAIIGGSQFAYDLATPPPAQQQQQP